MKNPPAFHRCVIIVGLLASLASPMIASGQGKATAESQIPTIHFDNIPLDMGIENLARQADLNYILTPLIPNSPVSKQWKNVSARTALTNLLAEHQLFLVESPATSVTLISTTNHIATPVDAKWIAADTNNAIPLIQFMMAPLDVVLTQLAKQAGVSVAMDSKATARPPTMVSMRWKNLKPRQAIAALCENYNLVLTNNPVTGAVRIAPK